MVVTAHIGHWILGLLESLPVVIVLVLVAWRTLRERYT